MSTFSRYLKHVIYVHIIKLLTLLILGPVILQTSKKNYSHLFKKGFFSNRFAGLVLLSNWGQKNYPLRDPENLNLRDLAQAAFEERI